MYATKLWLNWINANFYAFEAGEWLEVPSYLPHPLDADFDELSLAEPVGQDCDYALSLDDDSRIHVHEHRDGTLVAHRDRHDPGQGAGLALMHVATETTFGKVVGFLGAVLLAGVGLVGVIGAAERSRRG